MTKKVLSQVQAAEMGFSRRVHGVTLGDKSVAVKFVNLWIDSHLSFESRDPSYNCHRPRDQNNSGNIGVASPPGLAHRKALQRSNKDKVV